jgi:hypothetical protein
VRNGEAVTVGFVGYMHSDDLERKTKNIFENDNRGGAKM